MPSESVSYNIQEGERTEEIKQLDIHLERDNFYRQNNLKGNDLSLEMPFVVNENTAKSDCANHFNKKLLYSYEQPRQRWTGNVLHSQASIAVEYVS